MIQTLFFIAFYVMLACTTFAVIYTVVLNMAIMFNRIDVEDDGMYNRWLRTSGSTFLFCLMVGLLPKACQLPVGNWFSIMLTGMVVMTFTPFVINIVKHGKY